MNAEIKHEDQTKLFTNWIYEWLDVIPVLRTVRMGAYGASILTPTAFTPPLSLHASFLRVRYSDLDLTLTCLEHCLDQVESVCRVWSRSAQPFGWL